MERSIESIWKEGFLKSDALIAPKLNDLYNQKSKHVIEKFKSMFRKNLAIIIAASILLLVAALFLGIPFIGLFICLLLALQAIIGYRELNSLEKIDKGESSYQYLKAFDRWLKEVISVYTRMNRFFYPLFFIAFILGFWFSKYSDALRDQIMNDPDTYLFYGIPVFYVLPLVFFTILFIYFSDRIYQIDIKTVYGRIMKKLDEIISDMEELRG